MTIVLAALALESSTAFCEGWGEWLGPRGDGTSSEKGWLKTWPAEGPPRLFEQAIGEGYSALSVVDGRLLLFHRKGDRLILESLDAFTGRPQWQHERPTAYVDRYGYNGGPRAQPVVARVSENAAGDPQPGDGPAPGADEGAGEPHRSVPLVFALGPEGVLSAHALSDGKEVWAHDLEGEFELERFFFGAGPSPLVDRGVLYLNLGGTEVDSGMTFAIDAATGKVRWKTKSGGGAYATARLAEIGGRRHLFIFHRTGLSSLDPATGEERWMFPWVSRSFESVNAATPIVRDDLVFFSATYNTGGVALKVKSDGYDVLWKDDLLQREKRLDTHWSTALLLEDHLYGFAGRHEQGSDLRCVDVKTGRVVWKWAEYLGRGSMIHADGLAITLGERGDLALLKLTPAGHEEVGRVKRLLSYPAWTPPTLADGVLYLRDERKLVALDLRVPRSSQDGRAPSPPH